MCYQPKSGDSDSDVDTCSVPNKKPLTNIKNFKFSLSNIFYFSRLRKVTAIKNILFL